MKDTLFAFWALGMAMFLAVPAVAQDESSTEESDSATEETASPDDTTDAEEKKPETESDEAAVAPEEEKPAEDVKEPAPEEVQVEKKTQDVAPEEIEEEDQWEDAYSAPRRPFGTAAPGLGFEPAEPMLRGVMMADHSDEETPASLNTQRFGFHGFLRIPFNMGIGNGKDSLGNGSSDTKLHTPPMVPDTSYLDWRYTNNTGGPWTEFILSYGNKIAAAHVSIAAYNITDGGYRELTSQLGINQSFVSLSFPNLFGDNGGIVANVGVFANRYGAAGRYSADMYDTYLFGATHVAGENIRAFYDVGSKVTLHFEQGFGGKLNVAPFIDNSISVELSEYPYLPYAGPEEQGTTLLHHEHLGLSIDDKIFIGGHFMMSWTQDAEGQDAEGNNIEDGQLINMGVDIKLSDLFFGDAYLGYSHVTVSNPLRLAGAIEFLHSWDGWSIVENYFTDSPEYTPNDGGTIDSVLFQYSFSLAKLLWHPREYWGQDRDLKITAFGLYNHVSSATSNVSYAENKLKYGGDVLFTPLKWLGINARYDLVQPDLENSYRSFHQITGGLVLRSDYVSNEQIMLSYTHYLYGEDVTAGWPNETHSLDTGVFKISAIMWW